MKRRVLLLGAAVLPLGAVIALVLVLAPAPERPRSGPQREVVESSVRIARLHEIAAAQTDRPLGQLFAGLLRDPRSPGNYAPVVARLYNMGERTLAMEVMDIGEGISPPDALADSWNGFLRMRRAIWRHEADIDALVESYSVPLAKAVADPERQFPEDLAGDPVMFRKLLPLCLQCLADNPRHDKLFEFLRPALRSRADQAGEYAAEYERVLRLRLAATLADGMALAGEALLADLASRLERAGRHQEVLNLAEELGSPLAETIPYRLVRAKALVALDRRGDALQVADELATETMETHFCSRGIGEIYLACGEKRKAVLLVRERTRLGNSEDAKFLASCGDADGVRLVVKGVIGRRTSVDELVGCRDACIEVGDDELAEELLVMAEKRAIEGVRRSKNPVFDFPYALRYRYEQENRIERLIDLLLPLYPEEERARIVVKLAYPHSLKTLESYLGQYGQDPEFRRCYEHRLELAKAAEERKRREASGVVAAAPARAPDPPPVDLGISIADLRERVAEEPDCADAHLALGLRLLYSGDVALGRAEVRRAAELGVKLGVLGPLRENSDADGSIDEGTDTMRYWRVCDVYLRQGLSAELEADMSSVLSCTRAHHAAHFEWLSRWYRCHDRPDEAEAATRKAQQLNPYLGAPLPMGGAFAGTW